MSNRSGSFLGGLLLGATLGTVTGLLAAPRSGRETRYLLRKSADAMPDLVEDLSTSLQLQADRLSESALLRWDETLLRLREAIAAGLEASQQTRQHLQQVAAEERREGYFRGRSQTAATPRTLPSADSQARSSNSTGLR